MHVAEASDNQRDAWDAFVQQSPTGSFLQSWSWGEFQRAAGFPVMRLLVRDAQPETHNAELVAACLLAQRPLPFKNTFWYAPWGPVLRAADVTISTADDQGTLFRLLAETLRERMAKRAVFVRVEPRLSDSTRATALLSASGYVLTGKGIQPKDSLVLDLAQSEDTLLRGMHPKARYNIRIARRHGVEVISRTDAEGLRVFLILAREVERRGEFHYHPESYYAAMLRTLAPSGMLEILVALYRGVPLAAHLLVRFGNTVTYAHGASSALRRQVMAPHLLQWEGILRAKAAGATRYDFFGIAPQKPDAGYRKPDSHPWYGITRFKKGFGGTEEHFVGAADLIGDAALYRAVEIGRSLRAFLR